MGLGQRLPREFITNKKCPAYSGMPDLINLISNEGGLVLALGGYHALAQTASQADIIMHSRLFYYARVRGVTVSYAGYRQWLRIQYLAHPDTTRIWEWHLLRAICNHRDRLVAASNPSSTTAQADEAAAAEQKEWMRDLLQTGPPPAHTPSSAVTPAWMAAAPRGDLYVDRQITADTDNVSSEQVPYPEQFAAIIKAVQSGKQIEGIVEIPDTVARNPVRSDSLIL